MLNGKRLAFDGVRVLNSTTYVTYYRNFTGPNVVVMSEPLNLTDPGGAIAFMRTMVAFNPGDDISAGFMGVTPDLEASVGIYALAVLDSMAQKEKLQISGGELARAVAPGVILYNLSYPATQGPLQPPKSPPTSNLWIAGAAFLLLLAGVFLLKGR